MCNKFETTRIMQMLGEYVEFVMFARILINTPGHPTHISFTSCYIASSAHMEVSQIIIYLNQIVVRK